MSLEIVKQQPVSLKQKIDEMEENLQLVKEFFSKVMVQGQDYGVIPGTDKPVLLKCGAEKLCELYGYAPKITEIREEKDVGTGYYRAMVVISLYRRGTGEHIADGIGEANTYEPKYRYRWVQEDEVPQELRESLKSREHKGRKFYRVENDELHGLWNTVLKMAKKRALVDATLTATRSSGIFTQDLDDFEDWIEVEAEEVKQEKPKVTDKQIAYIKGLSRQVGINEQDLREAVKKQFGKELEELNQYEASAVISMLQKRGDKGE